MNADAPTPRVGFAQLKSFIGKQVLFVGKIESLEHGLVHMAAPDGSKVQVQAGGMAPYDAPFAEILGTVVDPGTIREDSHTNLGDNFDLNLYNEFLKLSNGQYVDLFYPRNYAS